MADSSVSYGTAGANVPSPLPSRIETAFEIVAARSNFPSLLKSAVSTDAAVVPAATSELLKETEDEALLTGRNTTFDDPPPGLGFATVSEAVLAMAMSEARRLAVNWEPLMKVVARALPFQFTTDPETKPVPFTVTVNPAPPGATASGTKGWLISGTGFTVPVGGV